MAYFDAATVRQQQNTGVLEGIRSAEVVRETARDLAAVRSQAEAKVLPEQTFTNNRSLRQYDVIGHS